VRSRYCTDAKRKWQHRALENRAVSTPERDHVAVSSGCFERSTEHRAQISADARRARREYACEEIAYSGTSIANESICHMTVTEILAQFWHELISRPEGPLAFRFVLQPVVAIGLAIRDGIHDARIGRTPYVWTILFHPRDRKGRLQEGWHSIARVVVLAMIIDVIYQVIALRAFRPLETVVIAFVLAILPYLLARGPVTRIARRFRHPKHT
jgi:hypothetical protein